MNEVTVARIDLEIAVGLLNSFLHHDAISRREGKQASGRGARLLVEDAYERLRLMLKRET